jgi:Chromo (CHRromatin Organisation MOdifier) domain
MVILDRRVIKKKNAAHVEVLVKWSNLEDEEATWEDFDTLCKQFPKIKLEDKLFWMGEVLLRPKVAQEQPRRLGAVSCFEFKTLGLSKVESLGCQDELSKEGPVTTERGLCYKVMLELMGEGPSDEVT